MARAKKDAPVAEEEIKSKEAEVDVLDTETDMESSDENASPEEAEANESEANVPIMEEAEEEDEAEEEKQALLQDAQANMTAKEFKQFQELLNKTQFYAHKVSRATRSEIREMYRSEHIITEDDSVAVKTEATKLREDYLELVASADSRRILTGKIVGCRSANTDNEVATILAEVAFGNNTHTVLIPDFLLFHYDIETYRTPERQAQVERRVRDMIKAEIKFIVKHVDQKTHTAYADRLKAMERESYLNYTRTTRGGQPRVIPGQIVQGRVTCVTKNHIVVCALGSESTIFRARKGKAPGEVINEIAWSYVGDCRDLYRVNDIINVKVLDIKANRVTKYKEEYELVATSLSVKRTQKDPMTLYYDKFHEGEFCQATVTAINESGVFVSLKGLVDCLVAFPQVGEMPVRGDERTVRITKKTILENGRKLIFGVFADY